MAEDKKTPSSNPVNDLLWVIGFFIALAILWYSTGGPSRPAAKSGPFLFQPFEQNVSNVQKQTTEIIGGAETQQKEKTLPEIIKTDESIYKGKVTLNIYYTNWETDPQKEYVEITASSNNDKPIPISDWKIEGKRGLDIKIGNGVYLMFSGQVNPKEKIFLQPGERAVIITGKSPLGESFRLNTCTGYFEQFQDFTPYLPRECPYPKDEDISPYLNDDCLDYIDTLPQCEINVKSLPLNLFGDCQNYINEKINYKTCVEIHKNDKDFYKKEWRIYLGRNEEMWKQKRETITLYDENGKIIDQKSY